MQSDIDILLYIVLINCYLKIIVIVNIVFFEKKPYTYLSKYIISYLIKKIIRNKP